MELIHEGNEGAIIALEKFDITQGYKFSTYAVNWIRQTISRAVDDQDNMVRVPVHVSELSRKITRAENELSKELQRIPTTKEIADSISINEEKVLMIKNEVDNKKQPISLEMPVGEKESDTLGDFIPSDEPDFTETTESKFEYEELIHTIKNSDIGERNINIIFDRLGLYDDNPKTLEEVASIYGLSRERIRQIEQKTLVKIKNKLIRKKIEQRKKQKELQEEQLKKPSLKYTIKKEKTQKEQAKEQSSKPIIKEVKEIAEESKQKPIEERKPAPQFNVDSLYSYLIVTSEEKEIIKAAIKSRKLQKGKMK